MIKKNITYKNTFYGCNKKKYENAVNAIITAFKEKQGLDTYEGYWIGNQIGEVYDFGDTMTFDFRDILIDLKEDAPKDEIFKWRDYMMRIWSINHMAGGVLLKENNYRSWLKGCPRLTEEELNAVEDKWKTLVDEIAALGKKVENKK